MTLILDCFYLLAAALALPYWLYKLPRAQRYRAGIWQRLGFSPLRPPEGRRLWVHCASVGEASIPRKLVAELRRRYAQWEVVFSTNTDTGAARLRELYPRAGVFYMPFDLSFSARLALSRVRPAMVALVELEVWPNFMESCRRLGVPVVIVNGRISRRSRHELGLLSRLWRRIWEPVRLCCARSEDDARGFVEVGLAPEKVVNCGMLKCDVVVEGPEPAEVQRLRELFALAPDDSVIVAGSTHRGEEAALARAYRDLKLRHRRLRMVVAPRHVERAAEVVEVIQARGLPAARKTALEQGAADAAGSEVVVVDTIGELVACYALADCVFVGRSLLLPGGGQNVLEPAALGKPVVTGPHTANFIPEMELLKEAGAATVVRDRAELTEQLDRLLSDPDEARRMGRAGRRVVEAGRGATARTLEHLAPVLEGAAAEEPGAAPARRPEGAPQLDA